MMDSDRQEFVCSTCGGTSTEIDAAHSVLDERYPVGWCVSCTPWPKPVRNPFTQKDEQPARRTVALVRADVWDPAAFEHRKKVARARTLANKLTSKHAGAMSEVERTQAREAVAWLQRND
jgi:hypothetical protein